MTISSMRHAMRVSSASSDERTRDARTNEFKKIAEGLLITSPEHFPSLACPSRVGRTMSTSSSLSFRTQATIVVLCSRIAGVAD